MKASEWIDRVKAVKGIDSDYGIAKLLHMTPQAISGYRSKTPTMNEETTIKVAEALGVAPTSVLLDQLAEQTKNPELRTSLFGLANGFSIASKTAVVAIVVVALSPLDSRASSESATIQTPQQHIMLSNGRRMLTDADIFHFFSKLLSIFNSIFPFRQAS